MQPAARHGERLPGERRPQRAGGPGQRRLDHPLDPRCLRHREEHEARRQREQAGQAWHRLGMRCQLRPFGRTDEECCRHAAGLDAPGRCRRRGSAQVFGATGKASERQRDLPAQVMVYYVIALALYMGSSMREVLRCLLEGLRWLLGRRCRPGRGQVGHLAGAQPAGRGAAAAAVRGPGAADRHPAAPRGRGTVGWRLVSLDGSCLEVADTAANRAAFGVPKASRGESAFPQLRFVALVENGTHVLFGARPGPYADGRDDAGP